MTKDTETADCRRCGTCCIKGGPALHRADLELVHAGFLEWKSLTTLRRGELAFDPVLEITRPLDEEIVKIRGAAAPDAVGLGANAWRCAFYDEVGRACSIHPVRPLECQLLDCRDPSSLMERYDKERLSRADIVAPQSAMGEIIAEHERRCPVTEAARLALAAHHGAKDEQRQLTGMLLDGQTFRDVFLARTQSDVEILDFLFGRPLPEVLKAFGLVLEWHGQTLTSRRRPFSH